MLKLFIGSIFTSNVLLTNYLGIKIPKKNTKNIIILTTIINLLAGILNYFIYELLKYSNAIYFRNLTFVLSIVIVSCMTLMIYKYITKSEEDLLIPIVSNSLILGVSLMLTLYGGNFIDTLLYLISISIGYMLIMFLIYYLDIEFSKRKVLLALRGYPIMLITLGLIYMVIERL